LALVALNAVARQRALFFHGFSIVLAALGVVVDR
jgi:hypothetical protein